MDEKKSNLGEEILDFLYDNYLVNRKTNTIDYFWDYNDFISAENVLEIINENQNINTYDELIMHIESDLEERNFGVEGDYVSNVLNEIHLNFNIEELCEYFKCREDDLYMELNDFLYENSIYFSWNLNEANFEKIPFQLVLSQEKYLEDDYFQLSPFQLGYDNITHGDFNMDNIKDVLKDELLKILDDISYDTNHNMLGILVQSQGYELKDLYDQNKVEKSKFLKTLKEELCNYDTELNGMSITFAGKTDIKDYFNIINNKDLNLVIPKNVSVGLVNFINGGGCSMNVELEKDGIIPQKDIINIKYNHNNYDVDRIFGYYLPEVEVGTNNILTNYHETDFEKLIEDIVEIKNLEINKWNSKSKDKELER